MAIRVRHRDTDGRLDAVVLPPDIIRWEGKSRKTMSDLNKSPAMSDLAYLAWAALTRDGIVRAPFDTWQDGLVEVMPEALDDARPTNGDN
jgi:hypothetical protein